MVRDLDPARGSRGTFLQHLLSAKQLAAFIVVGLISTIVTLLSRYFFNFLVPFEVAVALS